MRFWVIFILTAILISFPIPVLGVDFGTYMEVGTSLNTELTYFVEAMDNIKLSIELPTENMFSVSWVVYAETENKKFRFGLEANYSDLQLKQWGPVHLGVCGWYYGALIETKITDWLSIGAGGNLDNYFKYYFVLDCPGKIPPVVFTTKTFNHDDLSLKTLDLSVRFNF